MERGADSFRLRRVSVRFASGKPALQKVDLRIARGEIVGFVGPSGAGKTTLFRLLNGTLRPSSGGVEIGRENLVSLSLNRLRTVRGKIGTVHQDLSLIPNLRVLHNVLAGKLGRRSLLASIRLMVLPPRSEVERAYRILEKVGIAEKLYQRTDRLSGGQRQRVAVARALFQEPAALLADEPVSSVDPARAREMVALLVDLARREGLTLCMSLHNLELAREYLPRLVGLRQGQLVFDRPTSELEDGDFRSLYDLETTPPPPGLAHLRHRPAH